MLIEPTELLDGVDATLKEVSGRYSLLLLEADREAGQRPGRQS